jgi:tight adherence protein B
MVSYVFIAMAAIGISGVLYACATMFLSGNEQVEDRLAELTKNGGRGTAKEEAKTSLLISDLDAKQSAIETLFGQSLGVEKILFQSGLNLDITKFLLLTIGMSVGVGVVVFVVSPLKLAAPVAGLFAAAVPLGVVMWCRKKRMERFSSQLPAALDLMGQALRAGQSLPAGIQLVGEQLAEPLGPEFQRAFEQQNLGVPLTTSLKDMADRIDNLDLRFFVTAVTLQRQTGGDLAEILDKISHLVRERFQIKGQIQALTGEGRISGVVLLGLPPVLFLVMLKLNYEYVMQLFNDPMGQKMLAGATFMQLIGAFAIKKIIDIKV